MDNKKIVYNNEQYNILTNINIGTTTFLICIDIFDKKLQYFKQELMDGKIKLTSANNLITSALDVNKKSISNKKKILDNFNLKIQESLTSSVFVDRNKVIELFKRMTKEIENCDLKYYIIDNASIDVSDSSIANLVNKFDKSDVTKDLDKVSEAKNELYYYNTEVNEPPKEKMVTNTNNIVTSPLKATDPFNNNPLMAEDPFLNKDIKNAPIISPNIKTDLEKLENELSQTQVIANILSSKKEEEKHEIEEIDVPSSNSIETIVNKDYVAPVNQKKEFEVEEKETIKKKVFSLKESPKFYLIIILVSLLIAVTGFLFLFNKRGKEYNNREIMKQLLDITTITADKEGIEYNVPEILDNNYGIIIKENLMDVDFNELIETNSDTTGWINIEGLDINYPVVQAKTNEYYTNHSYYKNESKSGWLHSDINTSLSNLGKNTIIYGSNPNDSTLFANLTKALDKKWYEDATKQAIKLSTINANTLWQVFAVYEVPIEEYYLTTKFESDEEYVKFLNDMKDRSIYDFNVSLNEQDKVLTLTTNKDDKTRIVLQAKLIKMSEKGD